jgi:DNA-binding transcriptional LysR family regulator
VFELRDLECFTAIVEQGSFRGAAAARGMTQPALSRRIAALERGVGTKLFSREHRQVELTPVGEAFARAAAAVLAQAAIAERVVRQADGANARQLRVCAQTVSRFAVISPAIRTFHEQHPNVSVSVVETPWALQFDQLRKGVLDVTVIRGPAKLGAGLRGEELRSDPVVVALPAGHRLASAAVVDVRDLADEPFIEVIAYRTFAYKDLMRGVCARAGFVPHVVQEVATLQSLILCVAGRLGIALMHDAGRELPADGVVYRPLHPKQPPLPLYAVWREDDTNPAVAAFLACLKDAATS